MATGLLFGGMIGTAGSAQACEKQVGTLASYNVDEPNAGPYNACFSVFTGVLNVGVGANAGANSQGYVYDEVYANAVICTYQFCVIPYAAAETRDQPEAGVCYVDNVQNWCLP